MKFEEDRRFQGGISKFQRKLKRDTGCKIYQRSEERSGERSNENKL